MKYTVYVIAGDFLDVFENNEGDVIPFFHLDKTETDFLVKLAVRQGLQVVVYQEGGGDNGTEESGPEL